MRDIQFPMPMGVPLFLIVAGMLHLFGNFVNFTKLSHIKDINSAFFTILGLGDTFQIQYTLFLIILDTCAVMLGIYFLKHVPEDDNKDDFKDTYKYT